MLRSLLTSREPASAPVLATPGLRAGAHTGRTREACPGGHGGHAPLRGRLGAAKPLACGGKGEGERAREPSAGCRRGEQEAGARDDRGPGRMQFCRPGCTEAGSFWGPFMHFVFQLSLRHVVTSSALLISHFW